jgi:hypothetical protein
MPITSTPPLSVRSVGLTVINGITLTFNLSQPFIAPLCLSTILISKKTSGPDIAGKVVPGDNTHTGRVYIDMNEATYTETKLQAVIPFRVIVSYDSLTLQVASLEVLRDLVLPAAAPALGAEVATVGNGAGAHHG